MASRIVVVDKIYHQPPNESPVGEALGFSRAVESDEIPYSRPLKIGPMSTHLEKGWVDEVGMVLIKVPTDAKSDVIVSLGGVKLVLQPGEHVRLPLWELDGVALSAAKECRVTVTVYPR